MFSCVEAGCHFCCLDTVMPLSLADIKRLAGLGYSVGDFVVFDGGERRLRNVDGRCFFLRDGLCCVYEGRPVGCRLYPLVMDYGGRIFVDPGCRHGDGFSVSGRGASWLRGFIKLLDRERRVKFVLP